MKLEKKTRKDFDQETAVIQTSSFTTSTDYGYFILLCNFPLSKTSIFKISETLLHHGSANHCTIVDKFCGVTVHSVPPGLRAAGPSWAAGRWAALGRRPRAAGPSGRRAAGLLLAKPVKTLLSYEALSHVFPISYVITCKNDR